MEKVTYTYEYCTRVDLMTVEHCRHMTAMGTSTLSLLGWSYDDILAMARRAA